MTPTEIESALATAKVRGFLVIAEPFDAESSDQKRLLDAWNDHCEVVGRHRVLVIQTGFGLWRAAIAFRDGASAEMGYVRRDLEEAFARHLGDSARSNDEAWFATSQHRLRAEALAFELAGIDAQPRDAAFEEVFAVHEL